MWYNIGYSATSFTFFSFSHCCNCVMITREDAAIDYSELRHKASPECHTRSASGERLSRQFSSANHDSTENSPLLPPGGTTQRHARQEHRGLGVSKSESFGLAELACHRVQRSVPQEKGEKR